MKPKKSFAPVFLHKWDEWLLINKPDTWSARTHWVLYYAIIFMIGLGLICFFVPNDPRNYSSIYVWSVLVALLAVVAFVFWIIYLLRFNVFKRYGVLKPIDKIKTFGLYFIAIGSMVFAVYIPPIIESIRANRAYTSNELVNDINTINLNVCLLNKDSIQHQWKSDTIIVRDTISKNRHEMVAVDDMAAELEADTAAEPTVPYRKFNTIIDTVEFHRRKIAGDSLVQINDTSYLRYDCPDYTLIYENSVLKYATIKQWYSRDLFYKIFKSDVMVDRKKLQGELKAIQAKYLTGPSSYYYQTDDSKAYIVRLKKKYDIQDIEYSIDHIVERKYRWENAQLPLYFRLFFYTTLTLTLLVFIFRQTTVRTFFISLLAALLLLIITALFGAFFNFGSITLYIILLCYYLVFIVFAWLGLYKKVRSVVSGIALNFMVFSTVFVPLIVVALYYEVVKWVHMADNTWVYIRYEDKWPYVLTAELLGVIILLLLISTLFYKGYRKWYALPEQ
jgi:hypothetical protein